MSRRTSEPNLRRESSLRRSQRILHRRPGSGGAHDIPVDEGPPPLDASTSSSRSAASTLPPITPLPQSLTTAYHPYMSYIFDRQNQYAEDGRVSPTLLACLRNDERLSLALGTLLDLVSGENEAIWQAAWDRCFACLGVPRRLDARIQTTSDVPTRTAPSLSERSFWIELNGDVLDLKAFTRGSLDASPLHRHIVGLLRSARSKRKAGNDQAVGRKRLSKSSRPSDEHNLHQSPNRSPDKGDLMSMATSPTGSTPEQSRIFRHGSLGRSQSQSARQTSRSDSVSDTLQRATKILTARSRVSSLV